MSIILEKMENAADLNPQTTRNVNHFLVFQKSQTLGKCQSFWKNQKMLRVK